MYYNRLDNKISKQFNSYANFSNQQKQWIDDEVEWFHYWHRREILPQYVQILRSVSIVLSSPEQQISLDKVKTWQSRIINISVNTQQCALLAQAAPFLTALSDKQVSEVEQALDKELDEMREELAESNDERRIKAAYKWFKRVGLKLNDEQKYAFELAFGKNIDLRQQEIELQAAWNLELVQLLILRRQREAEQKIQTHLQKLSSVLEDHYPIEIERNRRLWRYYVYELLNGLETKQKREFLSWLNIMNSNVTAISQDKIRPPENINNTGRCH